MNETDECVRLSTQLPNLKFGFGLATFIFLVEIVWGVQREFARGTPESQSAGGYAAAFAVVGAVVSTAYVLSCIARYHQVLGQIEGWSHPINAKHAVRFHFIPIFNLYWEYRWPREIARFVNWRMQTHRMSGVLVGTLVLLGFLVGGFLDLAIGLAVTLSGFAYLSRCLRDAFTAAPVPLEMHATSG